jgi:hypothetical protein
MAKITVGGQFKARVKRKLRRHRKYRAKGFKGYRGQGR